MLSGLLNAENLSQTLRDISQRRRQGILEVTVGHGHVYIYCVQGRVVEILDSDKPPFGEVIDILKRTETIPHTFQLKEECGSYKDLFFCLNERFTIEQEFFKDVLRHRILDRLYQLESQSSGFFTFQVRMVDYEKEFLPNISVGQLLLDLVALRSESARFAATFPPDCVLSCPAGSDRDFNSEEQCIVDLLNNEMSLAELKQRCVLSAYHLQDALLNLHAQGVISVGQASVLTAGEEPDFDDLSRAFEQAIDHSFAEAADLQANVESAPAVMHAKATVAPTSSIDGLQEPASVFAKSAGASRSLKVRLNLLNIRLLQSTVAPHLVTIVFILASLLIPLLWWRPLQF